MRGVMLSRFNPSILSFFYPRRLTKPVTPKMADRSRPKPRAITPMAAVIPDCIKANPIADNAADPLKAFTMPFVCCPIKDLLKTQSIDYVQTPKAFNCRKIYK